MLRLSGGRRLQSPPGSVARPTPARVRLAVMNRLAPRLAGAAWLDLCCGSGVMACEALLRGATRVVAVERDRRVAAVAQANLAAVAGSLANDPSAAKASFAVHGREVLAWLGHRPAGLAADFEAGFDLIYADPPYRAGLHEPIATAVATGEWLRPGGLLLLECASDAVPEAPASWQALDCRRYGGTSVLLLQPASAAEGAAAAVLVPGGHEQTHQGDGNQPQHDAAEEGFDHGSQTGEQSGHNLFMSGVPMATRSHQP